MSRAGKGVLLIVDDEPLKCATLKIELTEAGYDVLEAPDAATGLSCLASQPVDVVITDLRMPDIDGLQFLDRVKTQSPETQVILMTAYASVDTAVQAMKHGACDYLTKPFSTQVLVSKLDAMHSNGKSGVSQSASKPAAAVGQPAGAMPGIEAWPDGAAGLTETIAGVERSLIDAALRKAAGNQAKAAQFLGIPRTTLRDKMAKYGMVGQAQKRPVAD